MIGIIENYCSLRTVCFRLHFGLKSQSVESLLVLFSIFRSLLLLAWVCRRSYIFLAVLVFLINYNGASSVA